MGVNWWLLGALVTSACLLRNGVIRVPSPELSVTRPPNSVLDPVILGRRVRAARYMAGFESVADLVGALERDAGLEVSARTIYAIEKGKWLPTAELLIGLLLVLQPEGGMTFFLPALTRVRDRKTWEKMHS
jgi:DNA-binding XRE family transcriptional regulator